MDHDVKAVANVFYKLAREDGKRLTAREYQRACVLAYELSLKTLGETLFTDLVSFGEIPALAAAHKQWAGKPITGRLETRTRPIKEETPAWKVIRAAYMQFDYEERHALEVALAHNEPATPGTTTID